MLVKSLQSSLQPFLKPSLGEPIFTPLDIESLSLWLDASDTTTITHSSGSVSQLDDKSGNGNHATQGTGTNQPLSDANSQNNLNVLTFDGTNDFLRCSVANLASQPNHIFSVAKMRATGVPGRQYLYDGVTSNSARNILALDGNLENEISVWSSTWLKSVQSSLTEYAVYEGFYNGVSSAIGVNGERTIGDAGNFSLNNGITIGGNFSSNADFLDGEIAELIIINSELSELDRQKVEGYLAHKWGLTAELPLNHPFKYNPPQ